MKPQPIDDATVAFPASVQCLMPKYADIPAEFKECYPQTKWNRFFNDAFFVGAKNIQATPKEGIDEKAAWRHIKAVMRSFEPKDEHKEAAVAYLLSLWFEDISWESAQ